MPSSALAERSETIPDYSRLTRAEINSLVALHKAGKTQDEIAEALGCSQPTVSSWLRTFEDTRATATYKLNAASLEVAERLAQTKHAPTMLELLRDLGVTEKKAPAGEQRGGVNVYIGVSAHDVQVTCSTGNHNLPLSDSDSPALNTSAVDNPRK